MMPLITRLSLLLGVYLFAADVAYCSTHDEQKQQQQQHDADRIENNGSRTGRQWPYQHNQQQPSVQQYFYIDKFHQYHGPALSEQQGASAPVGLLPRTWEKYFVPYYNNAGIVNYDDDVDDEASYNQQQQEASFRQFNVFGSLFNNRFSNGNSNLQTFRPNRVPLFIQNPDASAAFGSCDAGSGEKGICVPNLACNMYGGKSSGTCRFGSVCCVNVVTRCAATVTLNNTYFQSPPTQLTTPTSCTMTIKLDTRLKEQTQSICQIRLDIISFTLAQPDATSNCITDSFQIGGALNPVPTICGDNDGQHMYIHVPPSSTNPGEVRLTVNLGAGATVTRSWNMRISMLPCISSSLAPADCLQYFSAGSGKFWSFNWRDVAANVAVRQLANQNYKVCFRTEVVNNKRADRICFTECTVTAANADAFLVSGATTTTTTGGNACQADYIGVTSLTPGAGAGVGATPAVDRICGSVIGIPLCTISRPFEMYYTTNNAEAGTEANNVGFCFTFQQTAV